ncbi:MAG: Rnf-Nqr domain containing protein [Lawsonibacter sp.]|nr:Rnf-Nqr domain containing protein [Lawsonibacter sp.]
MAFLELAGVALAALLSENFILVNCMGIGTRRQSFQDPLDALRTGYSLTAVMVLGAFFSWLAEFLVITRFGLQHFRLLFLSLLIPGLVAGLRLFIRAYVPELSRRMDGNLAAVSTNCAALGSALLIAQRSYGLGSALTFSLFGGIGATLALTSFASLREEVSFDHCPKCFRGTPILLLTAGLMALSLVGFYGLHLS